MESKIVAIAMMLAASACVAQPDQIRETSEEVVTPDYDLSSGYGVQRDYRTITGGTFTISAGDEGRGRLEGYYRVATSVFDSFVVLSRYPEPPDGSIVTITRIAEPDAIVVVLDDGKAPIAWLDRDKQGWITLVYSATERRWNCATWNGFYAGGPL